MIVLQSGRLVVGLVQTLVYTHNRKTVVPLLIMKLDYFNIGTELLFNLFILYYFMSISDR